MSKLHSSTGMFWWKCRRFCLFCWETPEEPKLSPPGHLQLLVWKLGWKFPVEIFFSFKLKMSLNPAIKSIHRKQNKSEFNCQSWYPLGCLRGMNPQQGLCSLPMGALVNKEFFITLIRVGLSKSETETWILVLKGEFWCWKVRSECPLGSPLYQNPLVTLAWSLCVLSPLQMRLLDTSAKIWQIGL